MNTRTLEQQLVIVGAGSGYWELLDLVDDINRSDGSRNYKIAGVIDDNPATWGKTLGSANVFGPLESAADFPEEVQFVFGIGSYRTRISRRDLLGRLALPIERFETLIHPSAKIYSTSSVSRGCIIHFGSVIFNHSLVEPFSIISANCVIATQNHLGTGALLGSGVITTQAVSIGSFSHVGQGALIGERCEIGAGAQIGMGGVVLQSVKTGVFAIGNPLRFIDRIEVPEEITNQWETEKAAFRAPRPGENHE